MPVATSVCRTCAEPKRTRTDSVLAFGCREIQRLVVDLDRSTRHSPCTKSRKVTRRARELSSGCMRWCASRIWITQIKKHGGRRSSVNGNAASGRWIQLDPACHRCFPVWPRKRTLIILHAFLPHLMRQWQQVQKMLPASKVVFPSTHCNLQKWQCGLNKVARPWKTIKPCDIMRVGN